MIRTLVIDDERNARDDLRGMLGAHPEIEVVGEAATVRAARELLASADYGLVFLDIQLLGGSGFDLVPSVRAGARIIFVTAHNEHAIRAFEVNALDYLLKPVRAERLARALVRLAPPAAAEAPDADETAPASLAAPPGLALRTDDIIHLSSGGTARFAPVNELCAIEAEENYSLVHLADLSSILVRRSLKAWEEILPPAQFMRVHRTAIVNLQRLTGYRRDAQKSMQLTVQGVAAPIPVGRMFAADLRARLPGTLLAAGE
jgi:two-component system LytT family response regulator